MLTLADVTLDMPQDESRSTSNVVLHLIWKCFIPHCSLVLTESKPATQGYVHVVKDWSQFIRSFPIHWAGQHEQSPCSNKTNFLSRNLRKTKIGKKKEKKKKPYMRTTALAWNLLAEQPACSIKILLMKQNIGLTQRPRQSSQYRHMWVSLPAVT